MNESVLEFGPDRQLVGVLARPTGEWADSADGPAIVITNSGIIHRVGANRVHVRLARFLAAQGFACLRYDLPGIGDSDTLGVSQQVEDENIAATIAAFDELERTGVADRFIMVGLCSGADHSFRVSCADPRVVGAILIDPTRMFSTWRHRLNMVLFRLRRTTRRALRPRVWWRLLTGQYQVKARLRHRAAEEAPRIGNPVCLDPDADAQARAQMLASLGSLVERRVHLYVVTTGHNKEVYSYRRQLLDAFPELPELESILHVDRRPLADHTFGAEADRRFLEHGIAEWLTNAGFRNTSMAGAA